MLALCRVTHFWRCCHLSFDTGHSSRVFVYGTLRRGGERHGLLERLGALYVGRGSVAGELWDLGAFPGAVKPKRAGARVIGEVYRLRHAARALKKLDEYEGIRPQAPARSLYSREITEVIMEDGARLLAWIYWLNRVPPRLRRIESGDYLKR